MSNFHYSTKTGLTSTANAQNYLNGLHFKPAPCIPEKNEKQLKSHKNIFRPTRKDPRSVNQWILSWTFQNCINRTNLIPRPPPSFACCLLISKLYKLPSIRHRSCHGHWAVARSCQYCINRHHFDSICLFHAHFGAGTPKPVGSHKVARSLLMIAETTTR